MFSITLEILYPERSGGGDGTPCAPPRSPLEPDAGSNILILHIYSGFFISYQLTFDSITICPFYDNFSISFLYLNLIYNIFSRGFI